MPYRTASKPAVVAPPCDCPWRELKLSQRILLYSWSCPTCGKRWDNYRATPDFKKEFRRTFRGEK